MDNKPGQKGQFTAIVTGTDDMTVTWSVDGNTSEATRVENGQLFLGGNETATIMTVTATSHADPTKSASATVYVVEAKYTITIGKMTHGAVTADPVEATKGHPGDSDGSPGGRVCPEGGLPEGQWHGD